MAKKPKRSERILLIFDWSSTSIKKETLFWKEIQINFLYQKDKAKYINRKFYVHRRRQGFNHSLNTQLSQSFLWVKTEQEL